ncbi:MAG: hypothetical protein R3Y35_01365 [Clostridia bacterium]
MNLKNNKGSTLVENIISVFLLAIFSVMVLASLVAALNAVETSYTTDETINTSYNTLEESSYGTLTSDKATLTFKVDGSEYEIDGTFVYDDDGMLGEFIKDD